MCVRVRACLPVHVFVHFVYMCVVVVRVLCVLLIRDTLARVFEHLVHYHCPLYLRRSSDLRGNTLLGGALPSEIGALITLR
jgi:hypothetical protein